MQCTVINVTCYHYLYESWTRFKDVRYSMGKKMGISRLMLVFSDDKSNYSREARFNFQSEHYFNYCQMKRD